MSTLALRDEPFLDPDGFLAFLDRRPGERWELVDGRPRAMTGGTRAHGRLIANLLQGIRPTASAKGCDAFGGLLVETPDGSLFEPDLIVECGPAPPDGRSTDKPTIVAEVLSPYTMHYDRGIKAGRYRAIPSLQQLIFVYQDSTRVESWVREGDDWAGEATVLLFRGDRLAIPSLGSEITLDAIYADILPAPAGG